MARAPKKSKSPIIPLVGDGEAPEVIVQAKSNRAPYQRGGVHFADTRNPVVLPQDTTPDQTHRLLADPAITLALVHVASGKSVTVPRDVFDAEGVPDLKTFEAVKDELLALIAEGETA